MATPRDTEPQLPSDEESPLPQRPYYDEYNEYTDARIRALSQRVDAQEDRHRRLAILLVLLAYALAFGYLVGRDNASCQR